MTNADYYATAAQHSDDPAQQVGWYSAAHQQQRFLVLSQISDLSGTEVLDVGCGQGALAPYLDNHFSDVSYVGIDRLPEMVTKAKEAQPNHLFFCEDVLGETFQRRADFILGSGCFNHRCEDNLGELARGLGKLFKLCRQGVAINLLSSHAPEADAEGVFYYFDPVQVLPLALALTPHVCLLQHYLPNDFTVYLYQ